ncbi:MAG: hypothetical protein JW902_04255, partial [Syntrophaceae bacterium]|nr:hypothetical protein [Syntrophaceae bacterium]
MNSELLNDLEKLGGENTIDTSNERDIIPDTEIWRRFMEASNSRTFCESWLALQCHMIADVRCGLVLLGPPDKGPFTPAAVWPSSDFNVTHLTAVAQQSLKERRGVILKNESGTGYQAGPMRGDCYIAYPVEVAGRIHGVVILDLKERSDIELQFATKQLHWGAAWIEVLLRRVQDVTAEENQERLKNVLDSVAITLEQEHFKPAAMAFVTKIATMLVCDRVSLGIREGKRLEIQALSHSADF